MKTVFGRKPKRIDEKKVIQKNVSEFLAKKFKYEIRKINIDK
jgi:hypothetical protein